MINLPISRVLVVEDDPMVRRLLVRHFQKKNVTVVEAPDAEQALAFFKQPDQLFDAVITDVHLPGMTGVDLATRIRASRPAQPIVFVTGDVDEDLARQALEGGSAGYLLKPFEFFELDAALAQALQAGPSQPRPPASSTYSPADATSLWLEEQRALMIAASARPVSLRPTYPSRGRFSNLGLYAKITAAILVLLGFAWLIGYGLVTDKPREHPSVIQQEPAGERSTVYIPYEAPQQEPRPERRPRR